MSTGMKGECAVGKQGKGPLYYQSLSLPIYQLTGCPFHMHTTGTNQNPVLGRRSTLSP